MSVFCFCCRVSQCRLCRHALWPPRPTLCKQKPCCIAEFATCAPCHHSRCRKPCKINYDHHHHRSPLAPRRCCQHSPPFIFPAGLLPPYRLVLVRWLWICGAAVNSILYFCICGGFFFFQACGQTVHCIDLQLSHVRVRKLSQSHQ